MSRSGPVGRYSHRARRVLRQGQPALNRLYNIRELGPHIIARLRAGMYFNQSCHAAGVNPDVAHQWRHLGKLGLGAQDSRHTTATDDHVWFYEETERALSEFEGEILEGWVDEARRGNWQASRDLLARRFPSRWAASESRQIEVHGAQQMQLELVWGDEDQQEQLEYQQHEAAELAGGAAEGPLLEPTLQSPDPAESFDEPDEND